MADYSGSKTLEDYKIGDRWIGISSILPTVNDQTPSNALTRVLMTFTLGPTTFTLDSAESEITIDNASTWACSIAARDAFLVVAGKWSWDMEFYQTGYTSPWTLYKGTIIVHDDVA